MPSSATTISSERSTHRPTSDLRPHAQPAQVVRQLVGPRGSARRRSAAPRPKTTATASGVPLHLRLEQLVDAGVAPGERRPRRFHSTSSCCRSSALSSGSSRDALLRLARRRPPAAARSARPSGPIVAASNRSVLYSRQPGQPLAASPQGQRQVELRRAGSRRRARRAATGPAAPAPPAARSAATNITWNSGERLRSRSGCSSSTSCSNGTSWCA